MRAEDEGDDDEDENENLDLRLRAWSEGEIAAQIAISKRFLRLVLVRLETSNNP